MSRKVLAAAIIALYLASGGFVVGSSEQAVVRRFGRVSPELRGSGLWWSPPWPFSQVDRVNLAAVRTVSLSGLTTESHELLPAERPRSTACLTGDSNLLHIRATVQYHLRPDGVADFLFRHRQPDVLLSRWLEAAVSDAATRCSVDYLQTSGLAALNERLTARVQRDADAVRLGIAVDQVTLDRIDPPTLVQADFLDVANARADAARASHEAETAGEQRRAEAQAAALQQVSTARREARVAVVAATGRADRFARLVEQLKADSQSAGQTYAECRNAAMQRLTLETLTAALSVVKTQWLFEGDQPVDLHLPPRR